MMTIQFKQVTSLLCAALFLMILSEVCEAKEPWREASGLVCAASLKMNRDLEFGFAPGVTKIGSDEVGKIVLKGPPLQKGDITATGRLQKPDGTVVTEFKDVDVIWNSKVRAFQFDVKGWRVLTYPTPGGPGISKVFSRE